MSQTGESIDQAIVIDCDGVGMEYEILQERFPNWKVVGQSLIHRRSKVYDAIELRCWFWKKTVLFDVALFFGGLKEQNS